jgi:hypothetical protein
MAKDQAASPERPVALEDIPSASLIRRVRTIVEGLDLDCECRSKLDGALQRFQVLEDRRQVRRLILDARHQVERIAAFLDFARELDELTSEEPDHSVFEEIAVLFDGMQEAAAKGSRDMRSAGQVRGPSEAVAK